MYVKLVNWMKKRSFFLYVDIIFLVKVGNKKVDCFFNVIYDCKCQIKTFPLIMHRIKE